MKIIVKKIGGMSLETKEKVRAVARRLIAEKGTESLVIVVSAMGKTTDGLLSLIGTTTSKSGREIDALLATGECLTASLLSLFLNEEGHPAIALDAHGAGIKTDDQHQSAHIKEIQSERIRSSLEKGIIVVVTGFQGIDSRGDLTTLGRGGSDLTAVALAVNLGASQCEILKEAPAIYNADPSKFPTAKQLPQLSYPMLLDMTFWGAKVLQYRSVALASRFGLNLYVGPAHSKHEGTHIKENIMIEATHVVAINSLRSVVALDYTKASLNEAHELYRRQIEKQSIEQPQMLHATCDSQGSKLYLSGPKEVTNNLLAFQGSKEFSSVTATCAGAVSQEIVSEYFRLLSENKIAIHQIVMSPVSFTFFVEPEYTDKALEIFYSSTLLSSSAERSFHASTTKLIS